ncbi:MAG: hypothetical protein R2705_17785 [Ilumatobacteraceae bacterium]
MRIFDLIGSKHQYFASDGALAVAGDGRERAADARVRQRPLRAQPVRGRVAHQPFRLAPLQDVSTEQLTTLTAGDVVGTEDGLGR